METLYGKNPKHIICQCNEEEVSADVLMIALNDRCPVCSQVRRIYIPKRDIKVKEVPHIAHYGQVA